MRDPGIDRIIILAFILKRKYESVDWIDVAQDRNKRYI